VPRTARKGSVGAERGFFRLLSSHVSPLSERGASVGRRALSYPLATSRALFNSRRTTVQDRRRGRLFEGISRVFSAVDWRRFSCLISGTCSAHCAGKLTKWSLTTVLFTFDRLKQPLPAFAKAIISQRRHCQWASCPLPKNPTPTLGPAGLGPQAEIYFASIEKKSWLWRP